MLAMLCVFILYNSPAAAGRALAEPWREPRGREPRLRETKNRGLRHQGLSASKLRGKGVFSSLSRGHAPFVSSAWDESM